MVKCQIMQGTVYAVLSVQLLLYMGLLILFGLDKAFIGVAFTSLGVISVLVGFAGAYRRTYGLLATFSAMSFAWIAIAIFHITVMQRMVEVPGNTEQSYFMGQTLSDPDRFDRGKVNTFRILYPTLYAIAIWFTSVGMITACLMPTPDSWKSPFQGSKASMVGGDPYHDNEWGDEMYPPPPVHFGDPYAMPYMTPPIMIVPTTPVYPPRRPHSRYYSTGHVNKQPDERKKETDGYEADTAEERQTRRTSRRPSYYSDTEEEARVYGKRTNDANETARRRRSSSQLDDVTKGYFY